VSWLAAWSLLKNGAGSLFSFLRSLNGWQLLCIGLALFGAIQTLRDWSEQRHSAKVEAQLSKCDAARKADQQAYAKAQADAAAKNLATVAKDKAERERITHDISQSYEAELASLRADLAKRLRSPAQGSAGKPGLPGVSEAPSGPDDASRVSIPTSLYVRGAELELQLERLQQWVNEQLKVDPNAGAQK
jgi:hypothetical protein